MHKSLIRIYNSSKLELGSLLEVTEKQHNYLVNVMRQKINAEIIVFNNTNGEFKAQIDQINKKSLTLRINSLLRKNTVSKHNLTLAFAPIKGDLNNLIIQKATELGINTIIPVLTDRTIVRNLKYEKLKSIAIEATEQSNRIDVPEIAAFINLHQLCKLKFDQVVFCYEQEKKQNILSIYKEIKKAHDIMVIIGPEGGFTEQEHKLITNQLNNVLSVTLNSNILRTETAAIVAIAIIKAIIHN